MDKILIQGCELWVRVGCTENERAYPQKLLMDIAIELPLDQAGKTDNILDTVDYAKITNELKIVLQQTSFNLIEKVAEMASQVVLKDKKVKTVTIRVLKRALPGIDSASVEITRS